jgi:hypothetical protein
MAFENRNGRRYYYRKTRIGDRVVSEYVGAGEVAEMCAKLDRYEWARREITKIETAEFRAELESIDAAIDEACQINKFLVDALFLINGYHKHKGQWRQKRK